MRNQKSLKNLRNLKNMRRLNPSRMRQNQRNELGNCGHKKIKIHSLRLSMNTVKILIQFKITLQLRQGRRG
jgi:hypothetical protein